VILNVRIMRAPIISYTRKFSLKTATSAMNANNTYM